MEKFPSRREANKEAYEQSEKYQAIETLTDLGFLYDMNELNLYHGRGGDGTPWRVDPTFNNSGNNTGNANINKIPALNTSPQLDIASSFAQKRSSARGLNPEIYNIISSDPDARIIDADFDYHDLNPNLQNSFRSAIRKTIPPILEGAPVDFADRESLQRISLRDFKSSEYGFFNEEDIKKNAEYLHLSNNLSQSLLSSINTRNLLSLYPDKLRDLMSAYIYNHNHVEISINGDDVKKIPISREFLSSWFRSSHIVGCKKGVHSATLRQPIDNYILFDLEKVNTTAEEERKNKLRNRRLGKIALAAEKKQRYPHSELVDQLNNNLYIKPESILHLAKQTPGYREKFEADTGNWEKFTLEEHTETVLRLFDDNYADKMPASTLPIMRMALLVHDIGKSEAARNNDKKNQRAYNLYYAEDFMHKNKVEPKTEQLILSMIGTGSDYAARWGIDHDPEVGQEFYKFCKSTIKEYLGTMFVDDATVTGLRDMLMVLQTCDSAAYTTMAVTRSAKSGIRYRNYGAFNQSFEPFHGLTGHRVKLK